MINTTININKKIIIMLISIAAIFTVSNMEVKAADFKENIGLIKGQVTPELEATFINKDKEYLEANKDSKEIENEIKELEKELQAVKNDYITTSNNLKIYAGNAALKNNAVRTAIVNRKNLINKGSSFKYDDQGKYIIGRDYEKEMNARKTFTEKDIDLSLEAAKEVIEHLDMDKSFLSKTEFVVSPYLIEGVNGYTITRPDGTSTVVISNQTMIAPTEWRKKSVKSTTLHEIGHVFYNNNRREIANSDSVDKYQISSEIKPSAVQREDLKEWKESPSENFAEDFRIFASSKLGGKSFEPTKKKTSQGYEKEDFEQIMNSVL